MSSDSYLQLQANITCFILAFLMSIFELLHLSVGELIPIILNIFTAEIYRNSSQNCYPMSFWKTNIQQKFSICLQCFLPFYSLEFYSQNIVFKKLLGIVFSLMCDILFIWNSSLCSFVSNFIPFSPSLLIVF